MGEELIKLGSTFLGDRKILIPEERLRLLYFSKEMPKSIGFQVGTSLSFELTLNGEKLKDGLIKEKVITLSKSGHTDQEIIQKLREQLKVKVGIVENKSEEPSAIYTILPVKQPEDFNEIPPPDYYPSYAGLSPEQKWIYLNWLQHIKQPIAKGYVFIYYYSLERQLIEGNQIEAAKELIKLSHYHIMNKEIIYMALFYSYLKNPNDEILKLLFEEKAKLPIDNLGLLFFYNYKKSLTSKELFEIISRIPYINKRYLNTHPDIYLTQLNQYLFEQFNNDCYNFYDLFKLDNIPLEEKPVFYNYSFSEEIRNMKIFNFLGSGPFINAMQKIHTSVHEKVKHFIKSNKRNTKGITNGSIP